MTTQTHTHKTPKPLTKLSAAFGEALPHKEHTKRERARRCQGRQRGPHKTSNKTPEVFSVRGVLPTRKTRSRDSRAQRRSGWGVSVGSQRRGRFAQETPSMMMASWVSVGHAPAMARGSRARTHACRGEDVRSTSRSRRNDDQTRGAETWPPCTERSEQRAKRTTRTQRESQREISTRCYQKEGKSLKCVREPLCDLVPNKGTRSEREKPTGTSNGSHASRVDEKHSSLFMQCRCLSLSDLLSFFTAS